MWRPQSLTVGVLKVIHPQLLHGVQPRAGAVASPRRRTLQEEAGGVDAATAVGCASCTTAAPQVVPAHGSDSSAAEHQAQARGRCIAKQPVRTHKIMLLLKHADGLMPSSKSLLSAAPVRCLPTRLLAPQPGPTAPPLLPPDRSRRRRLPRTWSAPVKGGGEGGREGKMWGGGGCQCAQAAGKGELAGSRWLKQQQQQHAPRRSPSPPTFAMELAVILKAVRFCPVMRSSHLSTFRRPCGGGGGGGGRSGGDG